MRVSLPLVFARALAKRGELPPAVRIEKHAAYLDRAEPAEVEALRDAARRMAMTNDPRAGRLARSARLALETILHAADAPGRCIGCKHWRPGRHGGVFGGCEPHGWKAPRDSWRWKMWRVMTTSHDWCAGFEAGRPVRADPVVGCGEAERARLNAAPPSAWPMPQGRSI